MNTEYIVTLSVSGPGGGLWPYGFDTIEEAAQQAHEWCDKALNAPNPEAYEITFERRDKSEDGSLASDDPDDADPGAGT